jgi:hypothetical protein
MGWGEERREERRGHTVVTRGALVLHVCGVNCDPGRESKMKWSKEGRE